MPVTYMGPQLAKYGKQAGAVLEFQWVPDPLVFSKRVLRVRDDLADRSIPLAISKGIVARDVQENFEGEHDPQGMPWAPWSSATHISTETGDRVRDVYTDPVSGRSRNLRGYAENLPKGHTGKILQWREILRECATDEASYTQHSGKSVNDDSLFFDTGALPPYWVYHEQPDSPNSGRIPQRSFLGLSDEGALLVLEAFEEWFDDIIENAAKVESYTTVTGKTFRRRRIPKGQPGAGRFLPSS